VVLSFSGFKIQTVLPIKTGAEVEPRIVKSTSEVSLPVVSGAFNEKKVSIWILFGEIFLL